MMAAVLQEPVAADAVDQNTNADDVTPAAAQPQAISTRATQAACADTAVQACCAQAHAATLAAVCAVKQA